MIYIEALYFKAGDPPVVVRMQRGNLKAMQDLVQGYIEVVPLTDELLLVCNEEGKVYGHKAYHAAELAPGHWDPIAGSFFIVRRGTGVDEGEFMSTGMADLKAIQEHLR